HMSLLCQITPFGCGHRAVHCQVEDGMRDRNVTGVQTCALPILMLEFTTSLDVLFLFAMIGVWIGTVFHHECGHWFFAKVRKMKRSEERRVGKERRPRTTPDDERGREQGDRVETGQNEVRGKGTE